MKLFNTATKAYQEYVPPATAGIYVCGITPYDSAHLGHIFTFMTYDLLQRRLEDAGHTVKLVRNITDIDEPIYVKARELGIPYTELAARETLAFQSCLGQLNFRPAFAEPLASDYLDEMAAAVKTLLDNGSAYRLDDDIYFDVGRDPDFGGFCAFSPRVMRGLFAMRGGDPNRAGKRQPYDFLLWKAISDPEDPAQWDSPVGRGRPGWHIECSVMSERLLGTSFDIHGGGSDLIFPHHECEIAQSRGLGRPNPATLWLHVAPLLHDGEKMSKSLGNLVFATELLKRYEPAVIRLALMNYHHRIGGEWQPELIDAAVELWRRVQAAALTASAEQAEILLAEVRAALDDDLNTLEVIDALHYFTQSPGKPEDVTAAAAPVMRQVYELLGLPVSV